MIVRSSTFRYNVAPVSLGLGSTCSHTLNGEGGCIAILGSTFKGNTGKYGGALLVSNASHVIIQGSRFEGNNATWGGAISAAGEASVDILPGEQLGCAELCVCTQQPLFQKFHQPIS